MEKKEEKLIENRKKYYNIYDTIANEFSDMWVSQNNASALRTFHHTLANQLKQGFITSVDDYDLYYIGEFITYSDGEAKFFPDVRKVIDNEVNNKEEETEVIINNVR